MKKEIKNHKLAYLLLLLILIGSAFWRLYRVGDLLGFYYDQGRDALKVNEILTFKDFPAIGPTTGIAGLFLGPLWYYLLVPFYFLGKGNPAVAASFIAFFDVGTVFLLYWFGREFYDRKIGLLGAFFWGFSYYLIRSARWFSNPSPLPFFTILLLYGLVKFFLKKEDKYLILISICLAVSLQLEMASAVFFIPSIALMCLIFRPKIKNKKSLFWAVGIFIAFLIPQILFEIKNKFLMTRNFFSFSKGGINTDNAKTWALPTGQFIKERTLAYFNILFSKLETNPKIGAKFLVWLWLIFVAFATWLSIKGKDKKDKTNLILVIFLFLPLFFLFFFAGNYGRLYDYYLTGFFPAFILLFALFAGFFLRKRLFSGGTSYAYWPILALIIVWFLSGNILFIKNYLSAGVDGPTHITLGNQLQSVDWIYKDAGQEKFNI
ncbi:MAG: glycosyltransferase family 39 protein, partial [Candidatus Shapirobacteria bacterium]|nr:glycosyltransferase family 39 protein [Candidatus Shapirobacteria bacterium]